MPFSSVFRRFLGCQKLQSHVQFRQHQQPKCMPSSGCWSRHSALTPSQKSFRALFVSSSRLPPEFLRLARLDHRIKCLLPPRLPGHGFTAFTITQVLHCVVNIWCNIWCTMCSASFSDSAGCAPPALPARRASHASVRSPQYWRAHGLVPLCAAAA